MENKWRQKLHLESPKGWLNDPNGLCFFKGMYHVFFQYSPDSAEGKGRKCWGHYQSENLIKWEFTGTVLFPDIPEDRNGVYSGSALPNGDRLEIFYTGNVKEKGNHDYITSGRGANVIYVNTKDCLSMSEKRVLLRNSDYPKNCSCHVRDPKIWEENGIYHVILGARTLDDRGEVIFYKSHNLTDWQFEKELTVSNFGYMWECPDYFTIDNHNFLSISPQGLPHGKFNHQNIYSSGYFKCENDILSDFEEWDYGFDFYAPQTFETPDGRRILIGWMGIGDIPYTNPTVEYGWQHCLTIPREITRSADGSLIQKPVRELENLRYENITVSNEYFCELPFEMILDCPEKFSLTLDGCEISFSNGVFTLKFNDITGSGRTERNVKIDNLKNIRIIADMSSLEIYLNGGQKVLSTRFYPNGDGIKLCLNGLSAQIYKLRGMEVKINEE